MNAMYCKLRKKKLFPSRQEMLFALLPDVPGDTENAAYLINGSCIYGAFLADDGSCDYTLTDDNLCFIASLYLGILRFLRNQKQPQDEVHEQDCSYCGYMCRLLFCSCCRRFEFCICYCSFGTSYRFLLRYGFRLFERLPYQCRKIGIQGL